jgi:acetate kinase
MKILVLNGGSSGLKGMVYEAAEPLPAEPPKPLWDAQVDWGRHPGKADLRIKSTEEEISIASPQEALEPVLRTVPDPDQIEVVGHRVVHGGKAFRETMRITPEVKAGIARMVEFAPQHNRLELEAIEAAERVLGPDVPQVAVFDTAFHATLPPAAFVYPGPYGWLDEGIRRYGFHGISHRYTSRRAAEILGRDLKSLRIITCHLGNGASLAAVKHGHSIDTTMGFTPLEGLMMGTRSGSIDPGILIYLVRHRGYTADQLDRILNKESGLKGVSGISGDMREILAAIEEGNHRAGLAFDVYVHRLCREIGGMLGSLGGLDVLVFTGGIGENCPRLREQVCRQFAFLEFQVMAIHTEEDWEIARECYELLRRRSTTTVRGAAT